MQYYSCWLSVFNLEKRMLILQYSNCAVFLCDVDNVTTRAMAASLPRFTSDVSMPYYVEKYSSV